MTSERSPKEAYLRRYTNLPSLIHILRNKEITLLDPVTWDDKNDIHFIDMYKQKSQKNSVLALCFTEKQQTYHHWRVFSHGMDGILVEFKKEALLEQIRRNNPKIIAKKVSYKSVEKLREWDLNINELPFLKRSAFRDEREFRILYPSTTNNSTHHSISIELSCIHRVVINPWLPEELSNVVKEQIRNMRGDALFRIIQSKITNSRSWKSTLQKKINA